MTAPDLDALTQLQQLADRQNITVEELLDKMAQTSTACTVAAFVPRFIDGLTTGTARTYKTPLLFLRDGWSVPPSTSTGSSPWPTNRAWLSARRP